LEVANRSSSFDGLQSFASLLFSTLPLLMLSTTQLHS
jgi:hypothetical protein